MTADGVDLVDKNDTRGVFLALLEKVANAAGADADEHLDKIGTRNREKRNVRFARDGLGQQGLTRSRRAHHQNALRDLAAELLKFLRVFQKFDDLLQLFLGFIDTGNVLECDAFLLVVEKFCAWICQSSGPCFRRPASAAG